jgi:hypothetical protein
VKVGDHVLVRLPHHKDRERVHAIVLGEKSYIRNPAASGKDAWVPLLIEGEVKEVHADFIIEMNDTVELNMWLRYYG